MKKKEEKVYQQNNGEEVVHLRYIKEAEQYC